MKKGNKMMRIASILFIAVLLSTCAISGTFAKFTTEHEGTVTATVAKWSVSVTGADSATKEFTVNLSETVGTMDNDDNVKDGVIAPGTEGSFNIEITYNNEVASTVTVGTLTSTIPGLTFGTPVIKVGGVEKSSIPVGSGTATVTITWEWPFTDTVETELQGTSLNATFTLTVTQVD